MDHDSGPLGVSIGLPLSYQLFRPETAARNTAAQLLERGQAALKARASRV